VRVPGRTQKGDTLVVSCKHEGECKKETINLNECLTVGRGREEKPNAEKQSELNTFTGANSKAKSIEEKPGN